MKYSLKIINSVIYVSKGRYMHAHLCFSPTQDAMLNIPGCRITSPNRRELTSFVECLPKHLDALNKRLQRREVRDKDRDVEWRLGQNVMSLPPGADASKVATRFTTLLSKVGPLLELGEVICKQIKRSPLKTKASVTFFGCDGTKIEGMTVEQWLEIRKETAHKIDPDTAEVDWAYAQDGDPYGVYGEMPAEAQQVGREAFARSPGSKVWVWFGDLPRVTEEALWRKHGDKLAFPAGLPAFFFEPKDGTKTKK